MSALDILGWVSAALIIVSLMQARVLRFRVLNLIGSALGVFVNAALEVWFFVAMNAAIAVINVYWIWRLTRERHDASVYEVIEVGVDDAYLRHVLRVNAKDVAATHPAFSAKLLAPSEKMPEMPVGAAAERSAFLVLRGDETVGMVLVRDAGAGVGQIELDYVTERFRDFTPGEFVYRKSGIFADKGFTKLVAEAEPGTADYYRRVGFEQVDGRWQRAVQAAA